MKDHQEGAPFAMLDERGLAILNSGHCPACGNRGFVIGPAAHGMARLGEPGLLNLNIECANVDCRSRYNVAYLSGQALLAHDLFDGRSGLPWPSEPK